ncbi:MAG: pilus assembly protein [Candidatus Methylumidiphilus sp.]
MDKIFTFHRQFRFSSLCCLGVLLSVFAAGVVAREIAGTPLVAYSPGGRDILLILGNTTSMDETLDSGKSKKYRATRAIIDLFKNKSTVVAKTVESGQMIGLGLMTYGGTRANSVYVYGGTENSPYTTYEYEFDQFLADPYGVLVLDGFTRLGTAYPKQACGYYTSNGGSPVTFSYGSFADFFYREAHPQSHPYCLPRYYNGVGYPRPERYSTSAADVCYSMWSTLYSSLGSDPNSAYTLCYGSGSHHASTPTMGYVRQAIRQLPKYTDQHAIEDLTDEYGHVLGEAFDHALSIAPIEGALLTACDYFNTKFNGYNGSTSNCFRGYPPRTSGILPSNRFSAENPGDSQGVMANTSMPQACSATNILLTDVAQNATADGVGYTPDWEATEYNPGKTTGDPLDPNPYKDLKTDPVLLALANLNYLNKGTKIPTFVVGIGSDLSPELDYLAAYGYNDGSALTYSAYDQASLKVALDNIVSTVLYSPPPNPGASASSSATNSTSLQTNTLLFQAQFTFGTGDGWTGNLVATSINTTSLNSGTVVWRSATTLPRPYTAYATRPVFTYKPETGAGIPFQYSQLSSAQKSRLGSEDLLNWVRGDNSNEDSGVYRTRSGTVLGDIVNSDPVYVGAEDYAYDILPEGAATLTDGSLNSNSYQSFVKSKATRQAMVYLGANDGMLHGFNAGTYQSSTQSFNSGDGSEVLAYVPNALIGAPLAKMAELPPGGTYFQHVFGVDGSSSVGDAFINGAWKTVLVGITGAGGKSVFALDVTAPSSFSASKVLWEISDTDAAASTPAAGDAAAIHGDLGYTLAQPLIVRLNGADNEGKPRWAAIVANGYNSGYDADNNGYGAGDRVGGHAVLFIINLADGHLIKKIDTGAAGIDGVVTKNGLSTPIAVDIDNNRTADYVYAGDLTGNMWKFDISDANANNWGSFYNTTGGSPVPKPMFVACASSETTCSDANRQPITAKPNVGVANASGQGGGIMVYVGTGKYFELGDNVVPSTPQTQTFYALWDDNTRTAIARSNLVAQTILTQPDKTITKTAPDGTTTSTTVTLRTTSANNVDYVGAVTPSVVPAKRGWYMDLLTPTSVTPNGSLGERVVAYPLVRSGRVIFESMMPTPVTSCSQGGTSWVMELDALYGKQLMATRPPFDLDGDGDFDSADLVNNVSPSGMKSTIGMFKTPALITLGDGSEVKVFSGSGNNGLGGDITMYLRESAEGGGTGRISWRQIK